MRRAVEFLQLVFCLAVVDLAPFEHAFPAMLAGSSSHLVGPVSIPTSTQEQRAKLTFLNHSINDVIGVLAHVSLPTR